MAIHCVIAWALAVKSWMSGNRSHGTNPTAEMNAPDIAKKIIPKRPDRRAHQLYKRTAPTRIARPEKIIPILKTCCHEEHTSRINRPCSDHAPQTMTPKSLIALCVME